MPCAGQDLGQRFANFRLVIDDEYRTLARALALAAARRSAPAASTVPTGSAIVNTAPPSIGQSTVSVPPWASTMPRLTANPTPVPIPVGLVVK